MQAETPPRETKATSVPSETSLHDAMTTVRERLKDKERWPNERALATVLIRHWTADIVSALEALHKSALVIGCVEVLRTKNSEDFRCSDLNWRNILLDDGGRVVLTHQCMWACNDAPAPHKMTKLMYAPPG